MRYANRQVKLGHLSRKPAKAMLCGARLRTLGLGCANKNKKLYSLVPKHGHGQGAVHNNQHLELVQNPVQANKEIAAL